MMPTVTSLAEEKLHKSTQEQETLAKELKAKSTLVTNQQQSSSSQEINELLKMVTEPIMEYRQDRTLSSASPAPTATSAAMPVQPKLGISRSTEDEYNAELFEQKFGSISPIFYGTSRNSISAMGAARASNFRSKFRKSHTCGSLFANCNCSGNGSGSSSNSLTAPIPIQAQQQYQHYNYQQHHYQHYNQQQQQQPHHPQQQRSSTERTGGTFHLSISPSSPTNDSSSLSPTTTSSTRYTSGIYSLSTQTSSATSAQLSRDESMSVSFDGDGIVSYSDNTTSQPLVKQAYSTETEAYAHQTPSVVVETLQVPHINSPPKLDRSTSPVAGRKAKPDRGKPPRRLFQSYSHPDTDFIFTDENKNPPRESLHQLHGHGENTVITSRDGKVEIKQPKRSSSPNIGQYQVLDVAVHPDILVKISPRHSPIADNRRVNSTLSTRSIQQRRRLLQRSHEFESGGSTSESEHSSVDIKSPTAPAQDNSDLLKSLQSLASPTSTSAHDLSLPSPTRRQKLSTTSCESASQQADDSSFSAAQRYFAESGILGPINTSSNLIRKTSKILQDSNIIEQIRKTSMILRANSVAAHQNLTSKPTTITTTEIPSGTTLIEDKNAIITIQPKSGHHSISSPTKLRNDNMEATPVIYATNSSPQSPHTMATTCGFSPNVTTKSCSINDDRDALIKSLQGEVVSLKDVIKSRDAEIVKLRREIHKLKSVLQQTTNHLTIPRDDLLQSPPSPLANRTFLPQQCAEVTSTQAHSTCTCCHKPIANNANATKNSNAGRLSPDSTGSGDSTLSDNYKSCSSQPTYAGTTTVACALATTDKSDKSDSPTESTTVGSDTLACNGGGMKEKLLHPNQTAPVLKKQGVSGESCETSMQQNINVPIQKYDKDYRSKQLIKEAIMDNDFLKNIDASQVRELVEAMYPLTVSKGEFVIQEGDVGAHLYVSAEGEFEVVKSGKVLGIMGAGKAFGELAILYNCTRTASVRVLADASLWVLDRRVFQQIMMRTGMQRIENSVNFLKSVPLLKNLSEELLAKIADVLEVEFYPAGTYIIRQGASGDTFFLISQGSVKVTQKLTHSSEEKEIRILERGDYFGEQALINEDKRTANIIAMAPGVECLTLDRESFTHLIGDLCELKEKNYGDENRVLSMKFAADKSQEIFGTNVLQEFPNMKLTDLEVVATLGIGGFGRVELVKAYQENRVDTFALKCLKKRHIVDTKQEEHVFSERTIMLSCKSPFICRLHRTFRDEKYVYMLLEACMGGEIWTMLRDRGSFDENATQFIIGCVLQAFEYLHSRGILYRDLKPENLMLDERGYVKLVDFGFAKYIGNSSKTWTFCGTPEYVAPEIILNKGHDRAVDYWALGILIHELLNGTPPFTANDPMKTYNIILKGIDMIDFPKHMSRSAVQLIKKLCRDVPAERLGYQKGGIQDIKKHKWFLGFDWDGLEQQLLIPPFVRPIAHPTDTSYFDKFPCDPTEPPDEFSGWDEDF